MKQNTELRGLTAEEIGSSSSSCCVALRVRRMSRIITRVYDDALRSLGLTSSQFTLLTAVAQRDGVTAAEIGFSLDIEKSTLSRNLKRLVGIGLIQMDPPAGRHGRGLHLTDAGRKAIQAAYPVWRQTQDSVEKALGDESSDQFDAMLTSAEKLVAA
ncbi:MAG: MarR family winged helix-turn-helix transcriptional regulator [Hyphomicrobiaceae bacterium]